MSLRDDARIRQAAVREPHLHALIVGLEYGAAPEEELTVLTLLAMARDLAELRALAARSVAVIGLGTSVPGATG